MLILLYLTYDRFSLKATNLNICVFVWNGSGIDGLDYPWDISKGQVKKFNLKNKVLHIYYTNLKTSTNSVKPIWRFSSIFTPILAPITFISQNLSLANKLLQKLSSNFPHNLASMWSKQYETITSYLTWTKCEICRTWLFLSAGSFGFARLQMQYIHVFKITFT